MNPVNGSTSFQARFSVVNMPSVFIVHALAGVLAGIHTCPVARTRTRAGAAGTGALASACADAFTVG